MIGRLTGRVVAEDADGAIVIDVQGVGFEVKMPVGSLGRAERSGSESVVLHVHTHVREDVLELFGFASDGEREVFRLLIGVQKIGPKIALGLLSALPPVDLATAIADGDLGRLARVPGIGKKTAERLVLELREKLTRSRLAAPTAAGGTGQGARLVAALTNMGYRAAEAEQAVAALGERVRQVATADLLRDALAWLTQRRGP
ncbi:MAG: Holliday junction branch migration protein RuvA [Polyangiaceae bacterium]|nr:Holliday junction branch migration protein RuvA [Polyangiaceae bacterium]